MALAWRRACLALPRPLETTRVDKRAWERRRRTARRARRSTHGCSPRRTHAVRAESEGPHRAGPKLSLQAPAAAFVAVTWRRLHWRDAKAPGSRPRRLARD